MFKLITETEKQKPNRVVVLGDSGFVGSHLVNLLKINGIEFKGFSTQKLDLREESSSLKLENILRPTDTLVFVSAIAPCRDFLQLKQNIEMASNVCRALTVSPVKHLVYISSDAVYSEDDHLVNEQTPPNPGSLHGVMHLAREMMLKSVLKETPLAILRLSLLYGTRDPHNGYGPNRFIRSTEKNENITLFGGGEEKRDHIHIEDAAEIILKIISDTGVGVLNIATGQSVSFIETAEIIISETGSEISILTTERQNPIVHRHFDVTQLNKLFPGFHFKSLLEGVQVMVKQSKEKSYG